VGGPFSPQPINIARATRIRTIIMDDRSLFHLQFYALINIFNILLYRSLRQLLLPFCEAVYRTFRCGWTFFPIMTRRFGGAFRKRCSVSQAMDNPPLAA
jgi:hypothetical protein